jgi:hypothetical protein
MGPKAAKRGRTQSELTSSFQAKKARAAPRSAVPLAARKPGETLGGWMVTAVQILKSVFIE